MDTGRFDVSVSPAAGRRSTPSTRAAARPYFAHAQGPASHYEAFTTEFENCPSAWNGLLHPAIGEVTTTQKPHGTESPAASPVAASTTRRPWFGFMGGAGVRTGAMTRIAAPRGDEVPREYGRFKAV